MFNYLGRIFNCIVFCHSAGSVDDHLVTLLKPNSLTAQTNARFLVKAAQFGIDLRNVIHNKRSQVAPKDKQINIEASGELAQRAKSILESYIES